MKVAIQKRNTLVSPPSRGDIDWMAEILSQEDVWREFGFPGPAGRRFRHYYKKGALIAGVISTVVPKKRVGFVIMFPAMEKLGFWELAYVIPDPGDRNLFTALNTTDIMGHYMFDHQKVPAVGWRTREGNAAADAVIRRIGYPALGTWEVDDEMYTFYRQGPRDWARRKRKIGAALVEVDRSRA